MISGASSVESAGAWASCGFEVGHHDERITRDGHRAPRTGPPGVSVCQLAVDLNLARPRFFAARQRHGQHAVLVGRLDARRVDRRRQREAAAERRRSRARCGGTARASAVASSLRSPSIVSTLFSNVTLMSSRFISGSSAFTTTSWSVGLVDVHGGHPRAAGELAGKRGVEHAIQSVDLERRQIATRDSNGSKSSRSSSSNCGPSRRCR